MDIYIYISCILADVLVLQLTTQLALELANRLTIRFAIPHSSGPCRKTMHIGHAVQCKELSSYRRHRLAVWIFLRCCLC